MDGQHRFFVQATASWCNDNSAVRSMNMTASKPTKFPWFLASGEHTKSDGKYLFFLSWVNQLLESLENYISIWTCSSSQTVTVYQRFNSSYIQLFVNLGGFTSNSMKLCNISATFCNDGT